MCGWLLECDVQRPGSQEVPCAARCSPVRPSRSTTLIQGRPSLRTTPIQGHPSGTSHSSGRREGLNATALPQYVVCSGRYAAVASHLLLHHDQCRHRRKDAGRQGHPNTGGLPQSRVTPAGLPQSRVAPRSFPSLATATVIRTAQRRGRGYPTAFRIPCWYQLTCRTTDHAVVRDRNVWGRVAPVQADYPDPGSHPPPPPSRYPPFYLDPRWS